MLLKQLYELGFLFRVPHLLRQDLPLTRCHRLLLALLFLALLTRQEYVLEPMLKIALILLVA
jgi:hypothetical protein